VFIFEHRQGAVRGYPVEIVKENSYQLQKVQF